MKDFKTERIESLLETIEASHRYPSMAVTNFVFDYLEKEGMGEESSISYLIKQLEIMRDTVDTITSYLKMLDRVQDGKSLIERAYNNNAEDEEDEIDYKSKKRMESQLWGMR